MSNIDPRAIVSPTAELAPDVTVGAYTVIGDGVKIGAGTWIGPHAVINGPTTIGAANKIFQFASIGDAPQDLKYKGEPTRIEIGDRNVFREFTTMNRGTVGGGGVTIIGSDNLFMAFTHVAHVCRVAGGGPGLVRWLGHLKQQIGITGTLGSHGVTREQIFEIFAVANIVGGTIVIPHTRRAVEYWDALSGK